MTRVPILPFLFFLFSSLLPVESFCLKKRPLAAHHMAPVSPRRRQFHMVASGDAEWRQFVPLVTATLVIGDIALGSPAVKAVTTMLYGGTPMETDTKGGARDTPGDDSMRESKSRIDVDATALEALQKAEEALERAKLADSLRPKKGSVEEVRKRLDQQFKDLQ